MNNIKDPQRTLILIKPDGVQRRLIGEIFSRVEKKGYSLVAIKAFKAPREVVEQHYGEHREKPFFDSLVTYMTSGTVVAAVAEGHRVVEGWRNLMGATDPTAALPGTIRGDYGRDWGDGEIYNLAHGSDSEESAAREIALWFPELAK